MARRYGGLLSLKTLRFPLLCSERQAGSQATGGTPPKNLRFPLLCSGGSAGPEVFVPAVDFRAVRELVFMGEVLDLIGFEPQGAANGGLRGPCPIHRSRSARSRSFAVNVRLKMYHCFTCGSSGNHLDLYAAFSRQGIYQAALDLCEKLHRAVPWIQPIRSIQKSPTSSS